MNLSAGSDVRVCGLGFCACRAVCEDYWDWMSRGIVSQDRAVVSARIWIGKKFASWTNVTLLIISAC